MINTLKWGFNFQNSILLYLLFFLLFISFPATFRPVTIQPYWLSLSILSLFPAGFKAKQHHYLIPTWTLPKQPEKSALFSSSPTRPQSSTKKSSKKTPNQSTNYHFKPTTCTRKLPNQTPKTPSPFTSFSGEISNATKQPPKWSPNQLNKNDPIFYVFRQNPAAQTTPKPKNPSSHSIAATSSFFSGETVKFDKIQNGLMRRYGT